MKLIDYPDTELGQKQARLRLYELNTSIDKASLVAHLDKCKAKRLRAAHIRIFYLLDKDFFTWLHDEYNHLCLDLYSERTNINSTEYYQTYMVIQPNQVLELLERLNMFSEYFEGKIITIEGNDHFTSSRRLIPSASVSLLYSTVLEVAKL